MTVGVRGHAWWNENHPRIQLDSAVVSGAGGNHSLTPLQVVSRSWLCGADTDRLFNARGKVGVLAVDPARQDQRIRQFMTRWNDGVAGTRDIAC